MEIIKQKVVKYLFIIVLVIVFFMGIGFGLFRYYSRELPPLSELQSYEMKIGSEVYDRNDNLIHIFYVEKRQLTHLQELPEYLTKGIIAVEDKTFYKHWGMDQLGLIRAILIDLSKGDFSQGASTITQQLARNMFLSLDKQIPRKIKELILAIRIERNFSKDEILEMYLNKSPFGPGLYGIEVGAKKYFGKDAKDLSIPEAALLIGMPQLPSAYYPFRHPERAIRRRNIVLRRMFEEKVITEEEYAEARATELDLFEPTGNFGAKDYFIEFIRRRLEREFGTTQLFTGGLKIYTALDMDLQEYADSVLNMNLRKFENKNDYEFKYDDFPVDTINIVTPYVQGSVFSIEPETGYVRVMIGGRNFNHSKLNRVMQSIRQPGSSFKPIMYSAAIVNGYNPATIIKDEPFSFIQSDTLFWSPRNYSNQYFGYTRLRVGLKKSRNVFAAKTIYDIGPRKVMEYSARFGITTPIYPFYTLSVGSMEVKPFELISAYTTFPNGGERVKPIYIRRVENKYGKILKTNEPEKIRVINEQAAYIMASLMKSVCEDGTGVGIRWQSGYKTLGSISYKWNAAGKTGTTDDFRDAWFIGYNKKLVTGIWVGFDDNSTLGRGQSGATAALPSWPYIMKKAVYLDSPKDSKGEPIVNGDELQFTKPEGIVTIEISKETGLLPKNNYEETMQEIFIAGTEPTPLSDSLNYNFLPTFYREHDMDSLVVDMGGIAYVWPDSIILEPTYPDTARPEYMEVAPRHEPDPIDLRGALIIQKQTIVERPDSLLWKGPDWLNPALDTQNELDKLIDSIIKRER